MINFPLYRISISSGPPATDPPPAWNTSGNGDYSYTSAINTPPTEGGNYVRDANYGIALTTDDGGATYDMTITNDGNAWTVTGLTLSDDPSGFFTAFEESPGNTINLVLSFQRLVASELIYGATPTILEDSLSMEDGELGALDEATVDLLTAWPGYKAELTTAGITKNALVTHPDIPGIFYCRKLRPKPEGSARAITTASLVGILADEWEDRRLREISAFGQQISVGPLEKIIIVTTAQETGEDPEDASTVPARRRIPKLDAEGEVEYKTIVTPSGSAERWNVNDPGITCIDTYFQRTAPSTTVIGTALTPPSAPTPPTYLWGTYEEPMRANHPNGWVLADRKISIIIPDLVWKVVDTFEYYQAALPD